jgi:nicotinamide-nucleotide adenylyltransferase
MIDTSRAAVFGFPQKNIDALAAAHADVVVAVQDPTHWQAAARAVRHLKNVWTTLVPWFATRATLPAFVGACDTIIDGDRGAPAESPPLATSRALVITRAQPFHHGHMALVEHGARIAGEVVIVVAAAEAAFTERNPFTAGERLQMVRAATSSLQVPVWIAALPSPVWAALAMAELQATVPAFDVVVGHNPALREMARVSGIRVDGIAPTAVSATGIRARLASEGVGSWLDEVVPSGVSAVLSSTSMRGRCAVLAQPERR